MTRDASQTRSYPNSPTPDYLTTWEVDQVGNRRWWGGSQENPSCAFFHTSGTYQIYRACGGIESFTVGNITDSVKGGRTVSTKEGTDEKTEGHRKVHVAGGDHSETFGDKTRVHAGTSLEVTLGSKGFAVYGTYYAGASEKALVNAPTISLKVGNSDTNITLVEGQISMKAAKVAIDGFIDHKGDMITSGTHADAGGSRLHVG